MDLCSLLPWQPRPTTRALPARAHLNKSYSQSASYSPYLSLRLFKPRNIFLPGKTWCFLNLKSFRLLWDLLRVEGPGGCMTKLLVTQSYVVRAGTFDSTSCIFLTAFIPQAQTARKCSWIHCRQKHAHSRLCLPWRCQNCKDIYRNHQQQPGIPSKQNYFISYLSTACSGAGHGIGKLDTEAIQCPKPGTNLVEQMDNS